MSGRALASFLASLAIGIVSLGASGAETAPPDQGTPETLFRWLDKNHDGKVVIDELPAGAPESTKAFLRKADKNGDKKVTLEELKEAFKAGPPPRPWLADDGYERTKDVPAKEREHDASSDAHRTPAPPHPERPRAPSDWNTLFKMLDKNHDGSLSSEEFAAGMPDYFPPFGWRARLARMERRHGDEPSWDSEWNDEWRVPRDERIPPRPILRGAWQLLREWGPPPWDYRDSARDEGWDEYRRPFHEDPWWFGFIPPGPQGERIKDMISDAVRQEVDRVFKDRSVTGPRLAEPRQSQRETQPDLKK